MPEPAQPSSPKNSGSFASLLASITSAASKRSEGWDESALADDIATISYEQALRAHRRVRVVEPETSTPPQSAAAVTTVPAAKPLPVCDEKKCKTASITLRLTEAEQAQLHERAATAQLSISAYLRSCIFETELLRAQVKEALFQISTATPSETATAESPRHKPGTNWRARFLPHWPRYRS